MRWRDIKEAISAIFVIGLILAIPCAFGYIIYDGYCKLEEYDQFMKKHPGINDGINDYFQKLNKKYGEDGITSGYIGMSQPRIELVNKQNIIHVSIYSVQRVSGANGVVCNQNWEGDWIYENNTWRPIDFRMTGADMPVDTEL